MVSAPAVDTPHSGRSLSIPSMKEPESTEAGHRPSADPDVEAARSEVSDKGEKKNEDEEDTYLHGMKLVCVFAALASSMFLIVLDQTVSFATRIHPCPALLTRRSSSQPSPSSPRTSTPSRKSGGSARECYKKRTMDRDAELTRRSYFVTQCSTIFLWGQALAFFEQKMPLIMGMCACG